MSAKERVKWAATRMTSLKRFLLQKKIEHYVKENAMKYQKSENESIAMYKREKK